MNIEDLIEEFDNYLDMQYDDIIIEDEVLKPSEIIHAIGNNFYDKKLGEHIDKYYDVKLDSHLGECDYEIK